MTPEQPRHFRFDVVSSSIDRIASWRDAARQMPGGRSIDVRGVVPQFHEATVQKRNGHTGVEYARIMAEGKAVDDLTALRASLSLASLLSATEYGQIPSVVTDGLKYTRLYSDSVQLLVEENPVRILEKPTSIESWLNDPHKGVMSMSGKYVEITTAVTGIEIGSSPDVTPQTVIVHTRVKMKPYTKEEVEEWVWQEGRAAKVLTYASGLSMWDVGREFYDDMSPMEIFVTFPGMKERIKIREFADWHDMSKEEARNMLYGSHPEVLWYFLMSEAKSHGSKDGQVEE